MNKALILLDFDNKDVRNGHVVGKRLAELEKYIGLKVKKVKVKESGKGFHVRIEAKSTVELLPEAITFIQLYLGSDRYRELNNLRRILGYRSLGLPPQKWNVLFTAKRKADLTVTTERITELSKEFEERLWSSFERWRKELAKSS